MDWFNEFMNDVGYPLLATIITAIMTYIGTRIKKKYEELANDKTKKAIVDTCVCAAEQVCKALSGDERFARARESALEMLNSKGIRITELELNMLIEAAVLPLQHSIKPALPDSQTGEKEETQ